MVRYLGLEKPCRSDPNYWPEPAGFAEPASLGDLDQGKKIDELMESINWGKGCMMEGQ